MGQISVTPSLLETYEFIRKVFFKTVQTVIPDITVESFRTYTFIGEKSLYKVFIYFTLESLYNRCICRGQKNVSEIILCNNEM